MTYNDALILQTKVYSIWFDLKEYYDYRGVKFECAIHKRTNNNYVLCNTFTNTKRPYQRQMLLDDLYVSTCFPIENVLMFELKNFANSVKDCIIY
jgi:hypothetical protein